MKSSSNFSTNFQARLLTSLCYVYAVHEMILLTIVTVQVTTAGEITFITAPPPSQDRRSQGQRWVSSSAPASLSRTIEGSRVSHRRH